MSDLGILQHLPTHLPQLTPPQWPFMARKRTKLRADDDALPEQSRKRRADDSLIDKVPYKKPKSSGAVHQPSNFPPQFYDDLSRVWLTSRALQELDRRNTPLSGLVSDQEFIRDLAVTTRECGPDLVRFARSGGPDLRHLRGFPAPPSITHVMESQPGSSKSSRQTRPTRPTTLSSKGKRSSAYDANFEQHCIDRHIYPPFYKFSDGRRLPKPVNLQDIRQALKAPRGSLSPSIVPSTAFEDFQEKSTTKSEGTLMRTVVPALAGDLGIPNEGHLPFINLEPITDNIAVAVPDFFDGVSMAAVEKQVREDLNKIIVPTKHANVPIAANLFLEVKGPAGAGDVAKGQTIQNGAIGTRLMWFLQNYGEEEPIYDGNAYTFSATLVDGTLKLYAHHLSAPSIPGQVPNYYITQLRAYALTGDDEVWLEGTAAFRNLRILAQGYRDQFIAKSNARARSQNVEAAAATDDLAMTIEEQSGSSPIDFFDCRMFAEPEEDDQETQEANAGLAIHHHGYDKDIADDTNILTDFAASFASRSTSVIGEHHLLSQRQPKLPRSPPSPSSIRQAKKRGPARQSGEM